VSAIAKCSNSKYANAERLIPYTPLDQRQILYKKGNNASFLLSPLSSFSLLKPTQSAP
jgi:hypothetical protein